MFLNVIGKKCLKKSGHTTERTELWSALLASMVLEAVSTVDWSSFSRFEWYFALFATIATDGFMHRPWTLVTWSPTHTFSPQLFDCSHILANENWFPLDTVSSRVFCGVERLSQSLCLHHQSDD